MFGAVQRALREVGLSEEQWALAREAIPRELRRLTEATND